MTGLIQRARNNNSKIWVLGNGGSASTASHAVADFAKTSKQFGSPALLAFAPSDMVALQTAYANDDSFLAAMANTLDDYGSEGDVVWIISVSGTSPNLLQAESVAKKKGMSVCATVGLKGGELAKRSDASIIVNSEDYQVVENVQLTILHYLVKELSEPS